MSDWGATHSMSIMAGLDQQMPDDSYMGAEQLKAGLKAGAVTQAAIDDSVYRQLLPMFSVGVMDAPAGTWDYAKLSKNVTTDASVASARKLSALSTVLLKNEGGLLPLAKGKKVAVIGFGKDNAVAHGAANSGRPGGPTGPLGTPRCRRERCRTSARTCGWSGGLQPLTGLSPQVVHGGGSGSVVPSQVVTPLQGIEAALGGPAAYSDGVDLGEAVGMARGGTAILRWHWLPRAAFP